MCHRAEETARQLRKRNVPNARSAEPLELQVQRTRTHAGLCRGHEHMRASAGTCTDVLSIHACRYICIL